jgi:hypothetical protein
MIIASFFEQRRFLAILNASAPLSFIAGVLTGSGSSTAYCLRTQNIVDVPPRIPRVVIHRAPTAGLHYA